MTNLLHSNDKFVTVHNKCPKIPLSASVHVAACWRSYVVCLSWYPHFFVQQQSKMQVSNLSRVSTFFFVNYALHPTPQIKMKGTVHARFKQFRIIFIYVDFFSHSDQYYHLRNFDLSSWITLYKWQELCLCCCFRTLNISFKLIYCVLWLKKDDRRV